MSRRFREKPFRREGIRDRSPLIRGRRSPEFSRRFSPFRREGERRSSFDGGPLYDIPPVSTYSRDTFTTGYGRPPLNDFDRPSSTFGRDILDPPYSAPPFYSQTSTGYDKYSGGDLYKDRPFAEIDYTKSSSSYNNGQYFGSNDGVFRTPYPTDSKPQSSSLYPLVSNLTRPSNRRERSPSKFSLQDASKPGSSFANSKEPLSQVLLKMSKTSARSDCFDKPQNRSKLSDVLIKHSRPLGDIGKKREEPPRSSRPHSSTIVPKSRPVDNKNLKAGNFPKSKPPEKKDNTNNKTSSSKGSSDPGNLKVSIVSTQVGSRLTQEEVEKIQMALMEKLPSSGAQFKDCSVEKGAVVVVCANEKSKDWLKKVVPTLKPWKGASLDIEGLSSGKRYNLTLWVPKMYNKMNTSDILKKLDIQNEGIKTRQWEIVNQKVERNGQNIVVRVDESSYKYLDKNKFKAYLGLGQVSFSSLKKC